MFTSLESADERCLFDEAILMSAVEWPGLKVRVWPANLPQAYASFHRGSV